MIPTQNNQISIIDRLRLYIDPVDSTWFARLKPASEEQITKLRQFLELDKQGLKLPEEYVNFLRYAGEGAGGLFEYTLQAEMSLSSMLSDDDVGLFINKEVSTRPYCFYFMNGEMGVSYVMNLSEREQTIYYSYSKHVVCEGFERLVFLCAVESYEKYYFRFSQYFAASASNWRTSKIWKENKDLYEYVHEVARHFHLQEAWFNDKRWYFAYSNVMSIVIHGDIVGRGGYHGKLCFNEEKIAKEMQRLLLSQIGARIHE